MPRTRKLTAFLLTLWVVLASVATTIRLAAPPAPPAMAAAHQGQPHA